MALGTQVVLSPRLRRGTLLILQPVWDARARPWCSFSAQGLGEAGQRQQRARKVTGGNSEDRHHAPAPFCPGQLWEPVGKRERAAPHLLHKPSSGQTLPRGGPSLRNAPSRGTWILERIQPQLSQSSKFNPVVEEIISL